MVIAICVAQELFNRHQVDTAHNQVACKRVAKRMDVHILHSELPGQALEVQPEAPIVRFVVRFSTTCGPTASI